MTKKDEIIEKKWVRNSCRLTKREEGRVESRISQDSNEKIVECFRNPENEKGKINRKRFENANFWIKIQSP